MMHEDTDADLKALREVVESCFESQAPLEIIYFGGGFPGSTRVLTPLRYCEQRGRGHIIALCQRSGIEKTFRLDRMHLPCPPMADGKNDFHVLSACLGDARWIEDMLSQIADLGNLPIERALAKHHEQHGEYASFFAEYVYGGYTLELSLSSTAICLNLGFEASNYDGMSYEFTPERKPRLAPSIGTHYSLRTGKGLPVS